MIAVDWGTSRLRAYRLDAAGEIVDRRRADIGALSCDGRHADVLAQTIAGWSDTQIVLCGTIGTRGGWREAAYLPCPADATAIAAGLLHVDLTGTALAARDVRIVPGVIDRSQPIADFMRGEETQIVGLLPALQEPAALVCLPGTHSKWVGLRDASIVSVRTSMTGETYSLFRTHSILARSMAADDEAFDAESFDAGLRRSGDAGGLLHHVFGVRTESVLGRLAPQQAPSWLSGLLIGHELRAVLPLPARVHLVGGAHLASLYARALNALGVDVRIHPEHAAARGMYTLSRDARL